MLCPSTRAAFYVVGPSIILLLQHNVKYSFHVVNCHVIVTIMAMISNVSFRAFWYKKTTHNAKINV